MRLPLKALLITAEPVFHSLLQHRLRRDFEVSGRPMPAADALMAARTAAVDIVCLDADLVDEADQPSFAARLVLVSAAPVVVLSVAAPAGSVLATELYQAGVRAVLHKPQGRLTLDMAGSFGDELVATLRQEAA